MSHTIETTKRNIEAAYGVAFENIGFGMLAACVDGSPSDRVPSLPRLPQPPLPPAAAVPEPVAWG